MVSNEQHVVYRRQLDTGAEAEPDSDEEAQLLLREELDFQDNANAYPDTRRQGCDTPRILAGPNPPRIQYIRPWYPDLQQALPNWLNRRFPKRQHQLTLLCVALLLWFFIYTISLSSELPRRDAQGAYVVNLDCTDTLWKAKNECGINGIDCRPFDKTTFSFRCPANCAGVKVLNPRAVGPLDINYRPLVIGDGIYRGDSFICGSALHSGMKSHSGGNCGRVNLVGKSQGYGSVKRSGIESIPFDSYFPLAFALSPDPSLRCPSDPRAALLVVSMFFTSMLSLFFTSASIFFPIFVLIFAHVSFVSDPPTASYRNTTVLPDHISMFAKRLLPALFCAVIIYRTTVKPTLSGLKAQVEKTIFWLGGFYFGALSNYTFDWIPISRLTAHDLKQQPGAMMALFMILAVLVIIIAGQVYFFWVEGRLLRYLRLYGLFLIGIFFCLAIPGVSFRLHHYILGLVLLPGTKLQTRSSLLFQGILLGLFVNGIARWDFDSILQTTDALRGDGKFESVIPHILSPAISRTTDNLTAIFKWAEPPTGMDGLSVLVNDVERARIFFKDDVMPNTDLFEWARPIDLDLNEYVRFAYLVGGRTLDYTSAGTLFQNGTWSMQQDAGS